MGKDMNLQPEQLGALFNMSRDPVLGIDAGRTVAFANPAAAQLGIQAGMDAGELLPEHILSDPGEQFIASFRQGNRRISVSVQRLDGLTLCVCALPAGPSPMTSHSRALQELTANLMTTRLALDALSCCIRPETDPALQDVTSTLYRQYYLLRRTCTHMRQADGVLLGELPFQPRVLDLGNVCRELCDTVGQLTEPMGVSVAFHADFSMALTLADRDLIEGMLANLLTNSLLHCKQGDVIRVELTRWDDRFIIAVNDPGTGIPPEKLTELFNGQPAGGESDASAGAGLGLLVARGAAERHGGSMILESRQGEGTSVRVSIPLKQSDSTTINTPMVRYRSDGMNMILTELAPLLDKKYFNRKMFD